MLSCERRQGHDPVGRGDHLMLLVHAPVDDAVQQV